MKTKTETNRSPLGPLSGSFPERPARRETGYWRWGSDNLFPNALAAMSRLSTTHRRIINDKADYVSGKGFVCDRENPALIGLVERANGCGESLRQLPLYPLFEPAEDGTLRSLIHYKDYEPMFEHYGLPSYIAGMNVSAIAYKTDRWNISRLDNSFQLSGVMVLDGEVDNEQEAYRIVKAAEKRFAGKPGQVMFMVKNTDESDHSKFVPIESANEGDWKLLHEQATSDIVVAHSWFRSLSGLDYSTGFSAERILHEYEIALNTLILGEQQELLEPVRRLIETRLGCDASSLQIVNRPPTRSKPLYMKVWEARKCDGLSYDPQDPEQNLYLAQITKYAMRSID